MDNGQISIFGMLQEYETPLIPPEKQKQGMKGWIAEGCCVFRKEKGFPGDWVAVCAREIVFEQDTRLQANGRWCQHCMTKNRSMGWYGTEREIFSRKPTAEDCFRYVSKTKDSDWPEEMRYYEYNKAKGRYEPVI